MAEAFSLSFDGSKAVIRKEEFHIDETLITEVTELPCTGEKWFKTTIPKDVEFRSYLKLEHRGMVLEKECAIILVGREVVTTTEGHCGLPNL